MFSLNSWGLTELINIALLVWMCCFWAVFDSPSLL